MGLKSTVANGLAIAFTATGDLKTQVTYLKLVPGNYDATKLKTTGLFTSYTGIPAAVGSLVKTEAQGGPANTGNIIKTGDTTATILKKDLPVDPSNLDKIQIGTKVYEILDFKDIGQLGVVFKFTLKES